MCTRDDVGSRGVRELMRALGSVTVAAKLLMLALSRPGTNC